jgi:pimeloyl-ACP methyl ester carboxylesterase
MDPCDDDLEHFAANGAAPLPEPFKQGDVEHEKARIWYAVYGAGPPVILLHGGLGHCGNWGYQVPALLGDGYQCILIDSRGHGRSTRDSRPYRYDLMATDVLAVMDALELAKAALVGWSDGACIALILADMAPERVAGVFFFACNMDPAGVHPFKSTPVIDRCFSRHAKDYSILSETPDQFDNFAAAVTKMMQTQPNYSADALAGIRVPVTVAQAEHDEFIKLDHAQYLARTIPRGKLNLLPGVSHFAPLQRPNSFNKAMLKFAGEVSV